MGSIQTLTCPNCGYPLPAGTVAGSIVKCAACGTTFKLPTSMTPEPDLGELLLGADFRDPQIPGWKVYRWEKPAVFGQFQGIPEWQVILAAEKEHRTDFLISTPGPIDDFDVSAGIRFLSGDEKNFFVGFDLRVSDAGYYQAVIDSTGHFRVSWYDKTEWGGQLVPWSDHPSLKSGLGELNTLRAILRGTLLRIYLNGVLAVSLHDTRFSAGKVRLMAGSYDQEMRLAVSNLQLRDVPPLPGTTS
jgi:hypothetical protein